VIPRILCVDDEPNVLNALERSLFDHFEVHTVTSGREALGRLAMYTYDVVLSDMRMPEMDGAALLEQVALRWPDTTRVLLTGQTDIDTAAKAINQGRIFRFLLKPCPPEVLINVLQEAAEHRQLRLAERELLDGTLRGAIQLLVDMLALASPTIFQSAHRLRSYVAHMLKKVETDSVWQYEISALLSRIGCVALPLDLVERAMAGIYSNDKERAIFAEHAETAARLLSPIPRLGKVAEIVRLQMTDDVAAITDQETRLGVEMLQIAVAVDARRILGDPPLAAVRRVYADRADLRRDLILGLEGFEPEEEEVGFRFMGLKELKVGMVLADDVRTKNGTVLVTSGRELNLIMLERMRKLAATVGLEGPFRVRYTGRRGSIAP
jgi:CheY-like chemotaxis protein